MRTSSDIILVSPPSPTETRTATPPSETSGGMPHQPQLAFEVNDGSKVSEYTVKLQQYSSKKGIRQYYECTQTQSQPMKFTYKVTLGDLEAVGKECTSKYNAKHEASKALWVGAMGNPRW
jgi:hypothetical protein